ncbi:D-alanyl-D-alanine carboxypeptidase family protein [Paracoccus sp. NFXS7]|uniref:glycosyl hydrolase 108 family protein n=1 Tax=Paracoccus sp. NFXS7 TaxID=2908653 RepID=UPI0032DE3F7D
MLKTSRDMDRLHPIVREKVTLIVDQLVKEGIPLAVFEAVRTPQRQAVLFAKGRTAPGPKVTWSQPWQSYHQYGLAVDLVIRDSDGWSWDDSGANARHWARMHQIAATHGMTALFNRHGRLIEKPHIQLRGLSIRELFAGHYPDGGDADWADALSDMIDSTSGGPPHPRQGGGRPALVDIDDGNPDDLLLMMPVPTGAAAPADAMFQRLHSFIQKAEGGFVNHPADKGGPTNMGITQKTLAGWRRREVPIEEVQALTREEADQIFRQFYFTPCRCAEMPDRTAMVVYNGAVLHGPDRSIRLLQQAFNTLGLQVDGGPLAVDGVIGRNTMAAARQTDAQVLSEAYLDEQIAYLRGLDTFETFGDGWLNRVAALREVLETLPAGSGKRPTRSKTVTKVDDDRGLLDLLSALRRAGGTKRTDALSAALRQVLPGLLGDRVADPHRSAAIQDLLRALLEEDAGEKTLVDQAAQTQSGAKPPLTPVNAALGEGIGRLLNGKKSIIGIAGLFATVLAPELGLAGPLIGFIRDNQTPLLTILATFTGWGFLGKIDKAIRTAR